MDRTPLSLAAAVLISVQPAGASPWSAVAAPGATPPPPPAAHAPVDPAVLDEIYDHMRRAAQDDPALAHSDALRSAAGRPVDDPPAPAGSRPAPAEKYPAAQPPEDYPRPKHVPLVPARDIPLPGAAAAAPESSWTRFMKWFTGAEETARPEEVEARVLAKAGELGLDAEIVRTAFREARRQGVDYRMVLAVIEAESAFDPKAKSPKGARGLMQLMPATAEGDLGVADADDLYSIQVNIRAGVTYLGRLWNRFSETSFLELNALNPYTRQDVKMAIAAYNAGPGRVAKLGRVPRIQETQEYVVKVLRAYLKYRAAFPAPES